MKKKLKISDDDSGEKSVSVLLSGEESELVFLDHANGIGLVSNFVENVSNIVFVIVNR